MPLCVAAVKIAALFKFHYQQDTGVGSIGSIEIDGKMFLML